MENDKIVKKISEILRTDMDHIVPALEKIKKETDEQEMKIRKMEEKV